MGFPAGGARTMTANLTGKLPVGTKKHSLHHQPADLLGQHPHRPRRPESECRCSAQSRWRTRRLGFHGFPLKIENKPPGNVEYIYEKASATGPYTRPTGSYTRYGDVMPLIANSDDRLAVFGSGDEIALDFDPAKLPALPMGWTRDYFFLANGYEKDMDFYAFKGDTVDPLPFRAMGTYPYPEGKYPLNQHLDDLLQYNTRHMSGNESPGYSFKYPK